MNIEEIRDYCLTLPYVTEDSAFGDDFLLFRVCDKIFACIGLTRPDYFVVKCDPDYALILRDTHSEIEGAWHWNKKYWNQVKLTGHLRPDFIRSLIRHSYAEVVGRLPRKTRQAMPLLEPVLSR